MWLNLHTQFIQYDMVQLMAYIQRKRKIPCTVYHAISQHLSTFEMSYFVGLKIRIKMGVMSHGNYAI
jgi:hypothetical protein